MSREDLLIELENFGPIRRGELPLGKLTVIIGPSSSGKTYIAKAVYFASKLIKAFIRELMIESFHIISLRKKTYEEYSTVRSYLVSELSKLRDRTHITIESTSEIIEKLQKICLKLLSNVERRIERYAAKLLEEIYETNTTSLINALSETARLTVLLKSRPIIYIEIPKRDEATVKVSLNRDLIARSPENILTRKLLVIYSSDLKDMTLNILDKEGLLLSFRYLEKKIRAFLEDKYNIKSPLKVLSVNMVKKDSRRDGKYTVYMMALRSRDLDLIIFSTDDVNEKVLDYLSDFIVRFYIENLFKVVERKLKRTIRSLGSTIVMVPGMRRTDIILRLAMEKLGSLVTDTILTRGSIRRLKEVFDLPTYLVEYVLLLTLSIVSPSKTKFYDLVEKLERLIMCGELETKESQILFHDFRYNIAINMPSSSASVQQLSSIFILTKYCRRTIDRLIIEDPEIHCHASIQAFTALLLSALANNGMSVVVTTHSHYIVQRLYSLMMLHKLKRENNDQYERTINEIVDSWLMYLNKIGCIIDRRDIKDVLNRSTLDENSTKFIVIRWDREVEGFRAVPYIPQDRTMPSLSEVLDMLILEDFIIGKSLSEVTSRE